MGIKDAALAAMTHDAMVRLWRPLVSDLVVGLMLHRFADAERGVGGHSIADLRANLAFLRRHRFHLASLDELIAPAAEPIIKPTVAFTVDDGYADFANVAAPVFAEFDCPVTVFVVTGAIDGGAWFWWDRVEYAIDATDRRNVELEISGRKTQWSLHSPEHRSAAVGSICESLKFVPNDDKERALTALADALEVAVPSAPPTRYSAMTWSDVRRCAGNGVTFAPHTVTHPMLTQVGDAQAKWEILESWRRLRSECNATVPVFCYPNGGYTARDVDILAKSDLAAAVTTRPQYASRRAFRARDHATRFGVPRFSYVDKRAWFFQVVTGVERLKMALREGRDGWNPIGGGPELLPLP